MSMDDIIISLGHVDRCLVMLERDDDDRAKIALEILRPIIRELEAKEPSEETS